MTDPAQPIILITGSTDGIGKQTALDLARTGARVLIHGRDPARVTHTVDEIRQKTGNPNLDPLIADLSSLRRTRELADTVVTNYPRLDVLINNAGVYLKEKRLTEDGLEMTFAVNHLAHFLLTCRLLDLLRNSAPARIITVSSQVHQNGRLDLNDLRSETRFSGYDAYARSKLANVLFTYELAERLQASGVTANCLHPGVISTKMLRDGFGTSGGSLSEGAATPVYLARSPDVRNISGKYFVRQKAVPSAPATYDPTLRKELWKISEKLVIFN